MPGNLASPDQSFTTVRMGMSNGAEIDQPHGRRVCHGRCLQSSVQAGSGVMVHTFSGEAPPTTAEPIERASSYRR